MACNFNVERAAGSGLVKTCYRFWQDETTLTLSEHAVFERKSKRHGWKLCKVWSRSYMHRNTMPRNEPPQDVKDEVLRQMVASITFQ